MLREVERPQTRRPIDAEVDPARQATPVGMLPTWLLGYFPSRVSSATESDDRGQVPLGSELHDGLAPCRGGGVAEIARIEDLGEH